MARMHDILNAAEAARAIGCCPQKVRERIKRGIWKFGSVVTASQSGNMENSYEINKRALAEWLRIPEAEVERRARGCVTKAQPGT